MRSLIEYNLCRAKFILPTQKQLAFDPAITSRDLFLLAIDEKPAAESRAGARWHIGNVRSFTPSTGYFAVGRSAAAVIDKFDAETKDFIEEEVETSPYTHCVFDADIGLLGIARKSVLAPTIEGLASRICQLLSSSSAIKDRDIDVEILPISNPEDFVKALQSAWQVQRFSATFRGPNPFDADEHFQKPLALLLKAADGEQGKAEISGNDLNRNVVTEVARSTAATGNTATARIKRTKQQKTETISLKGEAVKRRYDPDDHDPQRVLVDLTKDYNKVRSND